MWIWILLLVTIPIYNTIYGFLPDSLKDKLWIKSIGMLAAVVLLFYGIAQTIGSYRNSSSAYISSEGEIIKKRNFPWRIKITTDSDDFPVFVIEERYGDSSAIRVKPDHPSRYEVYNAIDGVGIRFFCKSDEVPKFKILIGP